MRRSHNKRSFLLALLAWFGATHFLDSFNICALRHRDCTILIFRGISYNALLNIGGRAIDFNPAALPQTFQKIALPLLVQQQLLLLRRRPSITHTTWVIQPVALADKLQQPLDKSGGHVLFNVVVSSALGPKWYRLRIVGQIFVEGSTMVERYNCVIGTVDDVYGTPNKEF